MTAAAAHSTNDTAAARANSVWRIGRMTDDTAGGRPREPNPVPGPNRKNEPPSRDPAAATAPPAGADGAGWPVVAGQAGLTHEQIARTTARAHGALRLVCA